MRRVAHQEHPAAGERVRHVSAHHERQHGADLRFQVGDTGPGPDEVAYCARKYRSYDASTGTYVARGGALHRDEGPVHMRPEYDPGSDYDEPRAHKERVPHGDKHLRELRKG